jgi:hypothetical protein
MSQQDNSLLINDQEFFQLDQLIGELPTKHGIKLVQFFNMVRQKRMAEEQQAKMPEKAPIPMKAVPKED